MKQLNLWMGLYVCVRMCFVNKAYLVYIVVVLLRAGLLEGGSAFTYVCILFYI